MEDLIRRWRQIGVVLPVAFVAGISAFTILGLGGVVSGVAAVMLITAVTAVGATAFSLLAFQGLERARRETEQRARYLAAINEASLALSSDLDLSSLLQRVVDLSCQVTSARYGALVMLDEQGKVAAFLTTGISEDERRRIGKLPEGKGLLGVVIREGKTLRVDRIAEHIQSAGFPPHHPRMTSFIGLAITYEGGIVGDLYLTDKNGGEAFTDRDEEMLRTFAAHAAIAIENARLYRQVQDLAVLQERDRIGMDLHDGVIQSLYATGLRLENSLEDLEEQPAQARDQLQKAIESLNQTIVDVRSYIFSLRPAVLADTDLAGAVGGLLRQLKVNALLDVRLLEEPGACRHLSEQQIAALFQIAQESLTNVLKHARASKVYTHLEQQNGVFHMTIADDGIGFDSSRPGGGQGLRNIRERVASLGGRLQIESRTSEGTRLAVEVPVTDGGKL